MIIKLDKKKAYDKLNQKFIQRWFTHLGFFEKLTYQIWSVLRPLVFFALVNQIQVSHLNHMEIIYAYIYSFYGECIRIQNCIKVARNGHIVPYLMFADDYMTFRKANMTVARNVRAIMGNYGYVPVRFLNYHNQLFNSQNE